MTRTGETQSTIVLSSVLRLNEVNKMHYVHEVRVWHGRTRAWGGGVSGLNSPPKRNAIKTKIEIKKGREGGGLTSM
jgi:hypothetical protein